MARLFAGFIKAERDRQIITVPAYCLADDEKDAVRILHKWAVEKWDSDKGWYHQHGYAREIMDLALYNDERIKPLIEIADLAAE